MNKNIVQAKLAKQQKVNVEKGEETKALTEQIVNLQAFALIGHANYNREGWNGCWCWEKVENEDACKKKSKKLHQNG